MVSLVAGGCASDSSDDDATDVRPKGVELYVAGVQASRLGNQRLAQAKFEQATVINPKLQMVRAMLGDIYRSQNDYERALEQYEVLANLDPQDAENFYRLGVTYQFLQRVNEAVASYLSALRLNPEDVKSNMNLGLCYLTLNQGSDAIKYLRRATQLQPDFADAWTNLGVALDAAGDLAGAESAYKRALELDRNQNVSLLNLGANLIRQNKGEAAVSVMEEAIKRVDDAPTHTRYAQALTLAKRFDEALAQYPIALKLDPRYYPALNEQGFTYIAMFENGLELDDKSRLQAIASWGQSLKVNPNQPSVAAVIQQWSGNRMFGGQ
ncbi:MAG TPA: tetratricopeptide repeat protein [Tepidisphaeraceae bacterium]|jgi:superkiller protein 3|nr:tetratricopeptide repeat protein [Tepidisphaeraceae bacterium]